MHNFKIGYKFEKEFFLNQIYILAVFKCERPKVILFSKINWFVVNMYNVYGCEWGYVNDT